MPEIFDEQELKGVLAPEAWHLRHNNKTPILRQLSLMTFIKYRPEYDLELMAGRQTDRQTGLLKKLMARNHLNLHGEYEFKFKTVKYIF